MILFPAIDLKDGRCVRLLKGEMDQVTVFNDDPADQARKFAADGFAWLHVVDLDGAVEGRSVNKAAVEATLKTAAIPVQEILPWAIFGGLLALLAIYFVGIGLPPSWTGLARKDGNSSSIRWCKP